MFHEHEEIEIDGRFYGYVAGIVAVFVLGAWWQGRHMRKDDAYVDDTSKDYGALAGN